MISPHTPPCIAALITGSTAASVEMNTKEAYGTNTAEIATTDNVAYTTTDIATSENIAYVTAGDTIPATQNVAYGQIPPETDDCYDYVV